MFILALLADATGIEVGIAAVENAATDAVAPEALYVERSFTTFALGNKPSCFKTSTFAAIVLPDLLVILIVGVLLNFSPSERLRIEGAEIVISSGEPLNVTMIGLDSNKD